MKQVQVTWDQVQSTVRSWNGLIRNLDLREFKVIAGISRGGIIPAYMLARLLHVPAISDYKDVKIVDPFTCDWMDDYKGAAIILVDDIRDTGATAKYFEDQAKKRNIDLQLFCLVTRLEKAMHGEDVWFEFPWETKEDTVGGREQAVTALLRSVGEDPNREGLKDTPKRVSKMYDELCVGYKQEPKEILSAIFSTDKYDEMIVLKDIPFASLCEHHMLPFRGKVHFAYIPNKVVVGVSKIARLVECFARRLQIQERMTVEIGKAFEDIIKPKGVGVIVEAAHECMIVRGIKKEGCQMVTSYLGGVLREKPEAREEFLKLCGL